MIFISHFVGLCIKYSILLLQILKRDLNWRTRSRIFLWINFELIVCAEWIFDNDWSGTEDGCTCTLPLIISILHVSRSRDHALPHSQSSTSQAKHRPHLSQSLTSKASLSPETHIRWRESGPAPGLGDCEVWRRYVLLAQEDWEDHMELSIQWRCVCVCVCVPKYRQYVHCKRCLSHQIKVSFIHLSQSDH